MTYFFALVMLIVILLFGLSSISQSYATAKQAQAAIEASKTAQIASIGNLIVIAVVALVIVVLLAATIFTAWLLHAKPLSGRTGCLARQSPDLLPRNHTHRPGNEPPPPAPTRKTE